MSHFVSSAATLLRGLLALVLVASLAAVVGGTAPASAAAAVRDPERNSQKVTPWGWHPTSSPAR